MSQLFFDMLQNYEYTNTNILYSLKIINSKNKKLTRNMKLRIQIYNKLSASCTIRTQFLLHIYI